MLGSQQPIKAATAQFTAILDTDEYFGQSVAAVGDIDGNGLNDIVTGFFDNYYEGDYDQYYVSVLFLDLVDNEVICVSFQKIYSPSSTAGNTRFGDSLTALGDLNVDTVPDVAVGVPWDQDGGSSVGAVYIYFLAQDGTGHSYQKLSDSEGDFTYDLSSSEYFGCSVGALGDLNGDSVTELAVGARNNDDGGSGTGAVYILFLNTDGTCLSAQRISRSSGDFTYISSSPSSAGLGYAMSGLGDVNGDLIQDVLVGSYLDESVFVIFLAQTGVAVSFQKIGADFGGLTATLGYYQNFGSACSSASDVNGDGLIDIMVGQRAIVDSVAVEQGDIFILFLDQNGRTISHQKISDNSGDFTAELWSGNDNYARFGLSCDLAGDMNGDGILDFLVGTRASYDSGADHNDPGAIYILFVSQSFGKQIIYIFMYI